VLTPGSFMTAGAEALKELDMAEAAVESFLSTKTKREIWDNILKRRILAAPVATVADIAADPQLKAREYFVEVESAPLQRKLTMPGAFAKFSRTPVGPSRAAPRIGEHNQDVYGGLLRLSPTRLSELRAAGVI
ncbi:MAG: CoA transferase, partial [Candidatus Binataceae bacterium]